MVKIVKSKIDYVAHAINFSNRCEYRCAYCYFHSPNSRWRKERGIDEQPWRIDDDVEELRRQLQTFQPQGDILMSATHEPLGALTWEAALKILHTIEDVRPDLLPYIRILSKSGWFNDFFVERRGIPKGVKFGQTITTLDQRVADIVENAAARIDTRMDALRRARAAGHCIWVSAEPCFRGMDLVDLCMRVEPDEVWVGKLNHMESPLAMPPERIWEQVREARSLGYRIYLKWELQQALGIRELYNFRSPEAKIQQKKVGLEAYF